MGLVHVNDIVFKIFWGMWAEKAILRHKVWRLFRVASFSWALWVGLLGIDLAGWILILLEVCCGGFENTQSDQSPLEICNAVPVMSASAKYAALKLAFSTYCKSLFAWTLLSSNPESWISQALQ
jgi:hypothetical protein